MNPAIFEEQERQLFREFGIDDDIVNQLFPNISKKQKNTFNDNHFNFENIKIRNEKGVLQTIRNYIIESPSLTIIV